MSDEATKVTDQLRDKIKSKMDVAKFFAGFITLLIGFLLKDETLTPASKIGFVLLIASLGFCIAALFTYDHLLWPKEHCERKLRIKISDTNFQKHLGKKMVMLWWSLFVPAVGSFGFAFYFLLMQKLDLIKLTDYDNGVWKGALKIAFALPILGCLVMWPRMNKKTMSQHLSPGG